MEQGQGPNKAKGVSLQKKLPYWRLKSMVEVLSEKSIYVQTKVSLQASSMMRKEDHNHQNHRGGATRDNQSNARAKELNNLK